MNYGGNICLPRDRWRSRVLHRQYYSSKAKLSTVDYLEADRLDRIAAQVQKNCVSKLWKLFRCVQHSDCIIA